MCLCDTLTPWLIFGLSGPLRIILSTEMRFWNGRKVDWSKKKSGPFFQASNGYLWLYSLGGTQCVHATRGPWGLMS